MNAPGAAVSVHRLHFARPKAGAIWIYAVSGVSITGCRIEAPQASAEQGKYAGLTSAASAGIIVSADPHPPSMANPGQPGNFSGTLTLADNDIDMAATQGPLSLGIIVFAVGRSPDREVDIYISRNDVRNLTEPAINFRLIGGRAHAEANQLTTVAVTGDAKNPDVVRVFGSGCYFIERNLIDCGWADGTATGINVAGQAPPLPAAINAIVANNDVPCRLPMALFSPQTARVSKSRDSLRATWC